MPIPAHLPSELRPRATSSLVRLGRDLDGGYVVDLRDVEATKHLLSFGLNDDWSFERDFLKKADAELVVYDGSVGVGRYISKAVGQLASLKRPHYALQLIGTCCRYIGFFRSSRRHVKKFVGAHDNEGFRGFASIMNELPTTGGSRNIFLKCDIEGGEFNIMDQVINYSHCLTGAVFEFHDLHHRIDEVIGFVERFPLPLVHVHANNFSKVDNRGVPDVIECTFSSSEPDREHGTYPLDLDRRNRRKADDFSLHFDLVR